MASNLPFEQLIELFFDLFNKEYGEVKSTEIFNNVQSSNKANRFLADSLYTRKRYPPISFVTVINTGRNFLFKKPEVICFASLILLVKWQINVGNSIGLSDESYLKKMLFGIISECDKQKIHTSGNPNIFDRFHKIRLSLENDLANLIESQNADVEEEQDEEQRQKTVSVNFSDELIKRFSKWHGKSLIDLDACETFKSIETGSFDWKGSTIPHLIIELDKGDKIAFPMSEKLAELVEEYEDALLDGQFILTLKTNREKKEVSMPREFTEEKYISFGMPGDLI